MEKWTGKVAIVTGASAGIGAAIAEKLVEAGLQIASAFKSRIITSLIANKGDILDVNTFLEECKKLFAVRVLEYLNPTAKINFTLAAEYIIAHRQDIDPCIKYFSTRNFEICKDSDIDRYFDKVKQDILNKVVGLARRKERVEQLSQKLQGKSGKLYPLYADVTKEEDILAAFKWIKENLGPVHILINNAGVRKNTNLIKGDTKMWKDTFDTNVMALCIATREAIKDMKTNNVNGHIIHINSVVGHRVIYFPQSNVYPASKHAVTALTETLRQELNSIGSKIKISSISPGAVKTEIRDVSGIFTNKDQVELFNKLPHLESEDVADAVMYALARPPHVQVHEIIIRPVGAPF